MRRLKGRVYQQTSGDLVTRRVKVPHEHVENAVGAFPSLGGARRMGEVWPIPVAWRTSPALLLSVHVPRGCEDDGTPIWQEPQCLLDGEVGATGVGIENI